MWTPRIWKHCFLLLTYLPAPWSIVLLEKLTGFQLVKKFPAFYATRRFIKAFTSARQMSVSWSNPYLTSYFLNIHPHIILPSTPGFAKWSLSLRFPHQNPVYASHSPHTRYVSHPSCEKHRSPKFYRLLYSALSLLLIGFSKTGRSFYTY